MNIEELMKADPDIVLVGISSQKGNDLIEQAGLPTYTCLLYTSIRNTLAMQKETV